MYTRKEYRLQNRYSVMCMNGELEFCSWEMTICEYWSQQKKTIVQAQCHLRRCKHSYILSIIQLCFPSSVKLYMAFPKQTCNVSISRMTANNEQFINATAKNDPKKEDYWNLLQYGENTAIQGCLIQLPTCTHTHSCLCHNCRMLA